MGLPKSIQSNQGSNCSSHIFQQVMHELNIKQFKPIAYQVTLKRFHKTLTNIMKTLCLDSHKDWDNGVRMLLFSVRETFQESLGFSPFELFFWTLYGRSLKNVDRQICENTVISILDYVECFNYKLTSACEIEYDNLKQSQDKMK